MYESYQESVEAYADDRGILDLDIAAQVLKEHGCDPNSPDLPEHWDHAKALFKFLGY